MTRIFALLAALFWAGIATAQSYPTRTDPGVNDFANIIDSITEKRIVDKLAAINSDHDTEVVVVTLSSLQFYAQDSTIAAYGEGLFNTWGIGDAEANNGILLIVFRDDRELRIQVGAGYDAAQQDRIDAVLQSDLLPFFRDDNFAAGIEAGVDGLLARVIDAPAPNTATQTPSTGDSEGSGNTLYYIIGGVVAAIAGLVGLNRRNAAKFAAQPCSACGKTGLQKSREVLRKATLDMEGAGETRITCPSCGHVDATPYTISKLKPEEPKGGGKTDGGGATGKF